MSFAEAMDRWDMIRNTDSGKWILDAMKAEGHTTKTEAGKARFAELVEMALNDPYGIWRTF